MGLDINTPKGQVSLVNERYVIDIIKKRWTQFNIDIIETNKERESRIDNLIIKENELVGLAEIKCRNMTLTQMNDWGDSWLVTNQKIIDGAKISELLAVPFLGFLYLIPDDIVLYWKITDDKGKYLFDFEIKNTKTQTTCNGGQIYRDNAYLPRKFAKKL
jgi:hypothetical protein